MPSSGNEHSVFLQGDVFALPLPLPHPECGEIQNQASMAKIFYLVQSTGLVVVQSRKTFPARHAVNENQ
jgi:hypothetical protein